MSNLTPMTSMNAAYRATGLLVTITLDNGAKNVREVLAARYAGGVIIEWTLNMPLDGKTSRLFDVTPSVLDQNRIKYGF